MAYLGTDEGLGALPALCLVAERPTSAAEDDIRLAVASELLKPLKPSIQRISGGSAGVAPRAHEHSEASESKHDHGGGECARQQRNIRRHPDRVRMVLQLRQKCALQAAH